MATTVEQGRAGEDRATRALRVAGLEILERNYRGFGAECDVVAMDGATLVFVEIRTRSNRDCGDAVETVTPRKQRQVVRAAEHYLAFRRPRGISGIRFDVVGITAGVVTHLRDAFRP